MKMTSENDIVNAGKVVSQILDVANSIAVKTKSFKTGNYKELRISVFAIAKMIQLQLLESDD